MTAPDVSLFPEIPADAGLWTAPMRRPAPPAPTVDCHIADCQRCLVEQLAAELALADPYVDAGWSADVVHHFRARKLIERGWRPTQEDRS
ncbi:hypothetical protein ABW16_01885 [Mycolicibacter heraklionensis]|uniref:Oxidoreductase n=1 Tax=Mycolicibacter heraklionensis TaxID=512402 RepID=A0ABR5FKS1_9MYCO|nr:hypothetical protein [Mycolicibacter heraklionensis]KLO31602.1 hypothetical protein ABW16_01885 [Mycolicibacter heraklionensis]